MQMPQIALPDTEKFQIPLSPLCKVKRNWYYKNLSLVINFVHLQKQKSFLVYYEIYSQNTY